MTDLRERAPGRAAMEKLVSYRGTDELRELPFGLVRIYPEAMNWLRGARGERFMATKLSKLSAEWTVLHSIPLGNGSWDIDHLVIGPPGVFPINTKRLVDKDIVVDGESFRCDGWKRDYLAKSAKEAKGVIATLNRAKIASPVLPIIAISGSRSIKVRGTPKAGEVTVGVAPIHKVVKRLKRRPAVLTPEQVAHTVEALSESTAWTSRQPADQDADLLVTFRRLDRGVGRMRNLILVIGFAVMLATAWWGTTALVNYLLANT